MIMTAVEFLAKQALNYLNDEQENNLIKVIQKAIEMEKQQIIDAYVTPLSKEFWFKKDDIFNQQAEQYYNETYKPST
jgi:hypothetical protein